MLLIELKFQDIEESGMQSFQGYQFRRYCCIPRIDLSNLLISKVGMKCLQEFLTFLFKTMCKLDLQNAHSVISQMYLVQDRQVVLLNLLIRYLHFPFDFCLTFST
uniref:Putative ovule protein n=1 Tax=Solanum chacoense TaxID=4108 RepID=A0A0V0HGE0_SOLCH